MNSESPISPDDALGKWIQTQAEKHDGLVKPPKFYKVIVTAPDGRFGTKVIQGGLDKKSADFEARRYKQSGMIVSVLPEQARPPVPKVLSTKQKGTVI